MINPVVHIIASLALFGILMFLALRYIDMEKRLSKLESCKNIRTINVDIDGGFIIDDEYIELLIKKLNDAEPITYRGA